MLAALGDGRSGCHSVQVWDRTPGAGDPAERGSLLHPRYILTQENAASFRSLTEDLKSIMDQRLAD